MAEEKLYKCTLLGGCSFYKNDLCTMPGSQCPYKQETKGVKEDREEAERKAREMWFGKGYK